MTNLQTIRKLIREMTWIELEILVESFNGSMWPLASDDDEHLITGRMLYEWAADAEFSEDSE